MSRFGTASAGDTSAYDLEFRSTVDDAWYTVRVVADKDESLTVKFLGFVDAVDEKFTVAGFNTTDDVEEFVARFRPISEQAQDRDCSLITEGMNVCASLKIKEDDIRFYDAVVDAVHHNNHSVENEEEECLCTFLLFWKHGPKWGDITATHIADICLVTVGATLDPRVASFVGMAREKIQMASNGGISLRKGINCDKENFCSTTKQMPSSSKDRLQEMDSVRRFGGLVWKAGGNVPKICHLDHDRDLGGNPVIVDSIKNNGIHYFILIENMEKDLSCLSLMEFIHKQTSISPQAYVFPSLSSESYTRGAVVVGCKKKVDKIDEFLNNPDHIILSSRGRPWVITEKSVTFETFRTTHGSLVPESQHDVQNRNMENELRVICSGTEEFRTAKTLRDLFMEFVVHQRRLQKRLALEERKILQLAACK